MGWWHQGGHNSRWMVQAYCTLLSQPKSPPSAVHCTNRGLPILGVSAMILFGSEWPTVVTCRFAKDIGKQNRKGKGKGRRGRGGDNREGKREGGRRKARYEGMVVYSKIHAATIATWSPRHRSRWTLSCWPNVLMHERLVFLGDNVAQYSAICWRLWLVPSKSPPERATHGPPTPTSYSQMPLTQNRHRLHNRPADLRQWPPLNCDVPRPHDK